MCLFKTCNCMQVVVTVILLAVKSASEKILVVLNDNCISSSLPVALKCASFIIILIVIINNGKYSLSPKHITCTVLC